MEKKTPEQLAREYIGVESDQSLAALKFSSNPVHKRTLYEYHAFLAGYNAREIRDILIRYTENLRDYERESRNLIGFDEREDEEFVDVFLKGG